MAGALALAATLPSAASAACLAYGRDVVLNGRVSLVQAYGPPNYGETPSTDAREAYWRLSLAGPVCVDRGADELDEPERAVRKIQLVFGADAGRQKARGHRVEVTGRLFHAHTGHHHETMLLGVARLHSTTPR